MLSLSWATDAPRVLCLGAHADDIEIGCGGTLLQLCADSEAHVTWVVFSGDAARRAEAADCAHAFLKKAVTSDVQTLGFTDTAFPQEAAGLRDVLRALRDAAPYDLVFTHALFDRHQDHRTLAELTWTTFRDHLVLEYEIPKYEGDLGQPNLYMPLSAAQAARKVDLLMAHYPSQQERDWYDAETFRALLRLRGLECRAPSRYAEAFHARKLRLSGEPGRRGAGEQGKTP